MKRVCLLVLFVWFLIFTTQAQYLLYGTTYSGGIYNRGTIFYFNPLQNKDSVVFSFNALTGEAPACNLLLASDGLLYGVTYLGGTHGLGVIFSFDPKNKNENVLLDLDTSTGFVINGENDLVQGKNGWLYLCMHQGGTYNEGTIFRYNTITHKDSVIFNFDTLHLKSGANPMRGFYLDTLTGNLFGVTQYGGSSFRNFGGGRCIL